MDLQKLRGFYWTARLGRVSAAAEKLHLSQSAISHQLKALEETLGAKLYERTGRGIVPTAEGERLYTHARTVLHALDDLRAEFDDLQARPRGRLRLAAFRGIAVFTLPDIVQRYHARHPEVRLVVSAVNADREILRRVADGEVDLGVCTAWNDFEGLDYLEFASYDMYACVARDHPWAARPEPPTLADLAAQPLLLYERGTAIRDRIDRRFEAAGLHPRVAIEACGANALLAYARRGLGVGLVSGLVPEARDDDTLRTIPATDLFGALGYGFVLRTGRYRTAATRAFLEEAGVPLDSLG